MSVRIGVAVGSAKQRPNELLLAADAGMYDAKRHGGAGRFRPEHTGELAFHVAWVDQNLRQPDRHSPTIGILLCAGRSNNVVRYSLANTNSPLAVADYNYATLPAAVRKADPTDVELTALAEQALSTDLTHQAPPGTPLLCGAHRTITAACKQEPITDLL